MNSLISCLCIVGLVWAAFSVIGGLFGRRRGGNNWGNQGWVQPNNWHNDTSAFLGGMGLGWLLGSWGNNDHHHHHINNHDTIIDSNNDGIPDIGNEHNHTDNGSWFDWGNNNNDGGSWGGDNNDGGGWGGDNNDGGGWGGDSGGGWGGDSA